MRLLLPDLLQLRMTPLNRIVSMACLVMVVWSLSACSVRQQLLQRAADEMSQSSVDEEDIGLAREASAFYIKLAENLLRSLPGHLPLAQAVTSGLTQYAYAFLSTEADRTESQNLQQAQALRERAARMFERARKQGLHSLLIHDPELLKRLAQARPGNDRPMQTQAVGLAYWTAAAWGGQISLSTDFPDVVADLPLAVALARKAWEADPAHGDGALASLMGTLELARPGGSRGRALQYWDQAIEVSQGQNPGPWVAKAEGWAVDQQDRPAFEAWLNKAIEVSSGKRDLSSQIMRERAKWLLSQADTIF
jgi:TRAP transporter T-component